MRAGEAKLRERLRAMDFSTLGPWLGRCHPALSARLVFWRTVDAIFVGFKEFGSNLMLYRWALRHLV